jgi:hypothetical protein
METVILSLVFGLVIGLALGLTGDGGIRSHEKHVLNVYLLSGRFI